MKNKEIDYTAINYRAFGKMLNELETAGSSADEKRAAKLQQDIAKLDQQIAALAEKKAGLKDQLQAIEKK